MTTEIPMGVTAKLKARIEWLQGENDILRRENAILWKQLRCAHEAIERLKAQATSRASRMPRG